jgi:hypothetical protein
MSHYSKPLPTDEVSGTVNPSVAETRPTETKIASTSDASVARKVLVNLEAIARHRFVYTSAVEGVLRNNYDIPSLVVLHFPSPMTGSLDGPRDVYVNERS